MQITKVLCLIFVLAIFIGCEKETVFESVPSLRVASVSEYGEIIYDKDKLISVGDRTYLYDQTRLIGYRYFLSDRIKWQDDEVEGDGKYVSKFSVETLNGDQLEVKADSLWSVDYNLGAMGMANNLTLKVNQELSISEFENGRLVRRQMLMQPNRFSRMTEFKVEYDQRGNVSKVTEFHNGDYTLGGYRFNDRKGVYRRDRIYRIR